MKQKTHYEIWFQRKGGKAGRDGESAHSLSEAKKNAKKEFKKGSTEIIIDSWRMDNDGDVDDNSRKHYSLSGDGKTFKQF